MVIIGRVFVIDAGDVLCVCVCVCVSVTQLVISSDGLLDLLTKKSTGIIIKREIKRERGTGRDSEKIERQTDNSFFELLNQNLLQVH